MYVFKNTVSKLIMFMEFLGSQRCVYFSIIIFLSKSEIFELELVWLLWAAFKTNSWKCTQLIGNYHTWIQCVNMQCYSCCVFLPSLQFLIPFGLPLFDRWSDITLTFMWQFREMGYLPQAMVNYLALLGWGDGTENEFFTLEQLG